MSVQRRFNFEQVKANIARTKRDLPIIVAKVTETHFAESFEKGALDEHKWKEVQRRTPKTKAYMYPKTKGLQRRTSPILVGAGWKIRGGTLRKRVNRSITDTRWNYIRMMVDLPYAKALNEGYSKNNLVARPFMKHTKALGVIQKSVIDKHIKMIW
jgi:hypothetical protein